MMTDFEIKFTRSMGDMRPPGARELINALGDYAEGTKTLSKQDAADAHNYICALESKVCGLHHELEAIKQQKSDRLTHLMEDRKNSLGIPI